HGRSVRARARTGSVLTVAVRHCGVRMCKRRAPTCTRREGRFVMTVDDEAACRALYDELVAGRNEGSGARFAAAFAEDGELVAFDGSRLQGRATIEAFHQELFDKWMKGTRLTGGVDEVKVLGPDVASCTRSAARSSGARRSRRGPGTRSRRSRSSGPTRAGASPRSRTPASTRSAAGSSPSCTGRSATPCGPCSV